MNENVAATETSKAAEETKAVMGCSGYVVYLASEKDRDFPCPFCRRPYGEHPAAGQAAPAKGDSDG